MRIIFSTALDKYPTNRFPTYLAIPPRIGESVEVLDLFKPIYIKDKLPTRLVVVDVTWTSDYNVVCELWYKETDVMSAKISGIDLF